MFQTIMRNTNIFATYVWQGLPLQVLSSPVLSTSCPLSDERAHWYLLRGKPPYASLHGQWIHLQGPWLSGDVR